MSAHHTPPFRVEQAVGAEFFLVVDAAGYPAAQGSKAFCEKQLAIKNVEAARAAADPEDDDLTF